MPILDLVAAAFQQVQRLEPKRADVTRHDHADEGGAGRGDA
jgi:hypothetical protein